MHECCSSVSATQAFADLSPRLLLSTIPFGAASRLGIPSSTLESKIKVLAIDKRRFKPQ